MTPTATTPPGRTGQMTGGGPRAAEGHRRKVRQPPAPRVHRRVSGPSAGRTAPAPGASNSRSSATARVAPRTALGPRALAFARSLPDHVVIDRLVRGRAWILALGVMLAGIVAMQVELLKLGANTGRSVQRTSQLEVRHEALSASVASLADDQRIEKLAAGMGMVMAPPGSVGFLSPTPNGAGQVLAGDVHSPSSTTFLNASSTNGQVVTPAAIAAADAPAGTSSSSTSTASEPATGAATPSSYPAPVLPTAQSPSTSSISAGG